MVRRLLRALLAAVPRRFWPAFGRDGGGQGVAEYNLGPLDLCSGRHGSSQRAAGSVSNRLSERPGLGRNQQQASAELSVGRSTERICGFARPTRPEGCNASSEGFRRAPMTPRSGASDFVEPHLYGGN